MGLSYRVVYRRDPIPTYKQRKLIPNLNNGFVHVHGEIYIDDEQLKPGKQPTGFDKDPDDHSLMRYAEVRDDLGNIVCSGCMLDRLSRFS